MSSLSLCYMSVAITSFELWKKLKLKIQKTDYAVFAVMS